MAKGIGSYRKEDAGIEEQDKKKRSQMNALILGGVLLLGAILPQSYKYFAPLLFLLSPLLKVLNKLRTDSIQTENLQTNKTHSAYKPESPHSSEPYSYKPRDPKDPRKYKPIG